MAFPGDKETWVRWINKDLPTSELGSEIDAVVINSQRDFLERLQDLLGLNFLGGFGSLKLRLDDMDSRISGAGDFKADGSVPMTGNLNLGGQNIISSALVKINQWLESALGFQVYYVYLDRGLNFIYWDDTQEAFIGLRNTGELLIEPKRAGSKIELFVNGYTVMDIHFDRIECKKIFKAFPGVALRSPDLTWWKLKVDNAGNLSTETL